MPFATLQIPLGIVFLLVLAYCCLASYLHSRRITERPDEEPEEERDWNWPPR